MRGHWSQGAQRRVATAPLLSPPTAAAGRGGDARSELGGGETRSAASRPWQHLRRGVGPRAGAATGSQPSTRASAALPPPLSLLLGRLTLVLPVFVSRRDTGTGRTTRGQALTAFLSPLGHPAVDYWVCRFGGCHCFALFYFFPLNSLLKVEAWGREKKTQCRKGRYELTCQRRRRKTPVRGELSSPRRDRSPGFARSGAAAAVPQPGVPPRRGPRYRARPLPWRRAPRPVARDQGTPQLDFLCSFSKAPRKLVLLFHYL